MGKKKKKSPHKIVATSKGNLIIEPSFRQYVRVHFETNTLFGEYELDKRGSYLYTTTDSCVISSGLISQHHEAKHREIVAFIEDAMSNVGYEALLAWAKEHNENA